MKQIVFITGKQAKLQELLRNLEGNVSGNLIERETIDDVLALLSLVRDIDLIITPEQLPKEGSVAAKLSEFLISSDLQIPLLISGENAQASEGIHVIPPSQLTVEHLTDKIETLLGGHVDSSGKKIETTTYHPLPLSYLYYVKTLPCHIYKKVSDKPSYNVLIRIDQDLSKELLDTVGKEYKEVFVPREYHPNLINNITNSMTAHFSAAGLTLENRLKANSSLYTILKKEINLFGINHSISYLVELVFQSVLEGAMEVFDKEGLQQYAQKISESTTTFAYKIVHLNALYACYLMTKLVREFVEYQIIVGYLAFFSDIALPDRYLKIRSTEMLKALGNIPADEDATIREHALRASRIIGEYRQAPTGVANLIKKHHGANDGIGFPDKLPDDVNKIIMVFFITETMTHAMLAQGVPYLTKEVIDSVAPKFDGPNQQKIIKVLHSIC